MTIDLPDRIAAANQNSYSLSGTCTEDGPVSGTIGSTAVSGTCVSGVYSLTGINVSSEADGVLPISLTVTDAAGNISDPETSSVEKDATFALVSIDPLSIINIANVASYSISGTCSENGEDVVLTIDAFSATVSCATGVYSFPSLDLSSVADNLALGIQVYHSDDFGNGVTEVETVLKDTTAPTVAITSPVAINIATESSYSFSGTCSEDGSLSGTLGSVSISGTCSSGAFTIASIDTSAESDGTLSISLTITDLAANPADAPATANVEKDTVAPSVSLDPLDEINATNHTSYGLTGTCSENGQDVNLTIGLVTSSVSCSGGTFTFTGVDVSSVPDNPALVVQVDHSDFALNSTSESATVIKDVAPPTLTITTPTLVIFTGNVTSYTVSGTCSEDGSISGTLGSSSISSTCSSGSYTTTAADFSAEPDGTLIISLTLTDLGGNDSPVVTENVLKDTTPPLITITTPDPIAISNQGSYTISGTCDDDGASVSGTIDSIAVSATCASGAFTSAAVDMSGVSDGTLNISLSAEDIYTNQSTAITDTVVKDTSVPTVAFDALNPVNISNVNSYALSGTCSEEGQDVELTVGSFTSSTSCISGAFNFSGLNLSSEADSLSLSFSLRHEDLSTNPSTAATTNLKDTIAPVLTITTPLDLINSTNQTSYSFAGTCSEDGPVTGTAGSVSLSGSCTSGAYTLSSLDLSAQPDGCRYS